MDVKSLQVKVTSIRSKQNDLMALATQEKRELNAEEGSKFDTLQEERAVVEKNIDRCLAMNGEQRLNSNPNAHIDPMADDGANPLDIPGKDLTKYSFMRALRSLAANKPVDGLEGEISKEIAKRSGKEPTGFYLYGSAGSAIEARHNHRTQERRDLTLTTGVGGINQTVLFQSFIELLRHKTLIDKVGATYMAGLVGKFYIPRQNAAGSVYWLAEEGSPTTSNQTIDQVQLNANTLGAYTDISREFLKQTSLDAEAFVRNDLAKIMAIEIDRVSFNGSGSGNQPTGILQNGSITTVVSAADTGNGGAISWADAVALETAIAALDADMGAMSYVTNTKQRGKLKTTLRSSVAGATYIWDENEINGYPAFAGNNIPSTLTKGSGSALSALIFGNFNDLLVGLWGGLDVLVDPYTNSKAGTIRIVALQDIDIELRHPQSFAAITAATN
jgi:HK97 family phage major capsid protein